MMLCFGYEIFKFANHNNSFASYISLLKERKGMSNVKMNFTC